MSETESYYLLQDCLFGLFYQLYFLMKQCYWGRTTGYGWGWCKYGDGVNGDRCVSWICQEALESGKEYSEAFQAGKGHDQKTWQKVINQTECGQTSAGTPSPLQAFLCDCLPGFTCTRVMGILKAVTNNNTEELSDSNKYSDCYPEFLSHRGHTKVFGTECAVPMGFSGSFGGAKGTASGTGTAAAGQGNGMIGLGGSLGQLEHCMGFSMD
ncbi:variant erythrocyte surface antigen-1 family protein protein, putative [Babesia ovis]|uniref:Variant erythrocyte surface antigen-1 family protein protein, putative n=1 Tax=Babesia ovis TaxID=5869 RepID=A0A9W5TEX6_BABOV|nr:variant erythrocyte surface antigen-1 family protein protein, putative [Babesia ovis]